jgi:hypothetical protein
MATSSQVKIATPGFSITACEKTCANGFKFDAKVTFACQEA